MARKPTRKKVTAVADSTSKLVKALKFIALAQRNEGNPYQTHVRLGNQWAIACDGILTIGHKIDEDLLAVPHTYRLIDALTKCGDSLSITQLDNRRISVKSENFKAIVNCAEPLDIPTIYPDPPCAVLNHGLIQALTTVGVLASEGAQKLALASILLNPNTATATNGHVIMQYWHGLDLPPNLIIPKLAVIALSKADKTLAKFGFSANSATFYFDDDSWIKTQLYNEEWPDAAKILDVKSNAWPLPENFFKGLSAVMSFSESGFIWCESNLMHSHNNDQQGATYEIKGLPGGLVFNAKYLSLIEPYVTSIDLVGNNGITYFFSELIRGAIVQSRQ